MPRRDKVIERMRNNPGGWSIDDIKTVAQRHGIESRQRGSHVTFRHPSGDKLTVPASRPIKPVYIRRFLKLLEGIEE